MNFYQNLHCRVRIGGHWVHNNYIKLSNCHDSMSKGVLFRIVPDTWSTLSISQYHDTCIGSILLNSHNHLSLYNLHPGKGIGTEGLIDLVV